MTDRVEPLQDSSDRTRESGFALPAVLVILVALAFVGAAAAIMTSTEVKVAGLYNFSNRAGAAAAAGIEHATGHYVTSGSASGWPVTGTVDGYSYQVAIQPDSFDFGVGLVQVSWSADSGMNGSGSGRAVWLLTATAWRGPYRAEQLLRLTSQALDIQSESAFTANSGIQLQGNVTVSGVNSDMSGVAVAPSDTTHTGKCNENKPAIRLTDTNENVNASGSVNLAGNAAYASSSPKYVVKDPSVVWHTPEEVLGLPSGALDSYKQSGAQYDDNQPDTLSGIIYVTDDFGSTGYGSGNIQGTGILIVHNPNYDPRDWDPSDPQYNTSAAQAHRSDPSTYGPANIGNINGGTFKGIIIADKINKINGNLKIYGSVMSMTEIDVNIVGAGTAVIKYSCTAVQTVSNNIVAPKRLAWVAQ